MLDKLAIEQRRLELQSDLDSAKSQAERNRLGQFATPAGLAMDILRLAKSCFPKRCPVRFLDPAFGTGAFYSALLGCFSANRIKLATGYEIDPSYGDAARKLWAQTPLKLTLRDFTEAVPPVEELKKATLVVCNPPYVRHHHLDAKTKRRLRLATTEASEVDLNGLAGLYCHFVCLTHPWMAKDAVAVWLIPSEFMSVNYGRPLKEYLLHKVTLLRIHRFNPDQVQFDDALVSSAVVCFRNGPPAPENVVKFTYGGALARILQGNPDLLKAVWAALRKISLHALIGVGRVYGGGLHKLEPKELAEAPADTVLAAVPEATPSRTRQLTLSW